MKILKRIGITLLVIIGILLVVIGCYIGYMQAHYYRIPDHKKLSIGNNQKVELKLNKTYTATTYNVGFGAYNHNFDFFMVNLRMIKSCTGNAVQLFQSEPFLIQLMV